MKAIILVGGLGTRLRPITYEIPKPLVPVVNYPFICHQVELLRQYGIDEIIFSAYYMSEQIQDVLLGIYKKKIKMHFVYEETPLDTAGAVKNAETLLDNEPFLVFNGDVLTDLNLKELIAFHKKNKAKATLTLTKVSDISPYGLVIMNSQNEVQKFLEKTLPKKDLPNTINAGTYVLERDTLEMITPGQPFSFERQFFPNLIKNQQKVFGFVSDAYWIDIGTPEKLFKANLDALAQRLEIQLPGQATKLKVWIGKSCKIDREARLRGPSLIGNHCTIAANTDISDFVVMGDNVSVGENSFLEHVLLFNKIKIGQNVKLTGCIVGNNCVIEDDVQIDGHLVLAEGTHLARGTKLL